MTELLCKLTALEEKAGIHCPNMIIDCFTFYNEINMLKFRLHELYSDVDFFVVVESNMTYSGNKKEMNFHKVKDQISHYMDKIVYISVEDMPDGNDPWEKERHQRNKIMLGLEKINLKDTDTIIISDCDEIPDMNTVRKIISEGIDTPVTLYQDMYYYNINTRFKQKWYRSKVLNYKMLVDCGGAENARMLNCNGVFNGGWHFSYFGGVDMIKNKIRNFSHQEYNNEHYLDEARINEAIKNQKDLFDRDGVEYDFVEVENNYYLPKNYKMLL